MICYATHSHLTAAEGMEMQWNDTETCSTAEKNEEEDFDYGSCL